MFGVSDEGPLGPSWLIHDPSPGVRWAEEKMVHLAVLRENKWSFPSLKAAKENGLVLWVNIVVWGL